MAGQALLTMTGQLSGMFVVTNGAQIAAGSQFSQAIIANEIAENTVTDLSGETAVVVEELVPGIETEVATPFPDIDITAPAPEIPSWLQPFIIGSIVVIVFVLVIKLIFSFRRSKSPEVNL